MSPEEKQILTTALQTIADPRGNWEYGWHLLCELAGADPESHRAPFRLRSEDELRELVGASSTLKLQTPPGPNLGAAGATSTGPIPKTPGIEPARGAVTNHPTQAASNNLPTVLLVENDPDDDFLLRHAFKAARIANPVVTVPDGKTALDYLDGVGEFSDRNAHPMPGLILLDLRMPVIDGFGFLEHRQARPHLKDIPVVVRSSSILDRDVQRARELGADDYLEKPFTYEQRLEMVRALQAKWLGTGSRVSCK